jgi:gliding motility-associated-like protein
MASNQNNLGNTLNPWIYEPDVYVLTVLDETNRCISTDTVKVEAYSPVSFDLVIAPACQDSDVGSVSVVNLEGQADFYVFELDNGSVRYDSLFTGLSAGNYTLTVRDLDSCAVQLDFTIAEIPALPPQSFEKTYHFCGADYPLTLDVTANIDPQWVSYFWSNGMDTPQITITEEGDYSVEVLTGCDSYTYSFEVVDDLKRASLFAMPNAFSPNRDGWNDDFGPVAFNELGEYKLLVFDRWGEKVFESSDAVINWDGNYKGKPAAADVYIWKVVAKYDDCIEQPHQFSLKGNVTLLR